MTGPILGTSEIRDVRNLSRFKPPNFLRSNQFPWPAVALIATFCRSGSSTMLLLSNIGCSRRPNTIHGGSNTLLLHFLSSPYHHSREFIEWYGCILNYHLRSFQLTQKVGQFLLRQTAQKPSSDELCCWSKLLLMEALANWRESSISVQELIYILSSQIVLYILLKWHEEAVHRFRANTVIYH